MYCSFLIGGRHAYRRHTKKNEDLINNENYTELLEKWEQKAKETKGLHLPKKYPSWVKSDKDKYKFASTKSIYFSNPEQLRETFQNLRDNKYLVVCMSQRIAYEHADPKATEEEISAYLDKLDKDNFSDYTDQQLREMAIEQIEKAKEAFVLMRERMVDAINEQFGDLIDIDISSKISNDVKSDDTGGSKRVFMENLHELKFKDREKSCITLADDQEHYAKDLQQDENDFRFIKVDRVSDKTQKPPTLNEIHKDSKYLVTIQAETTKKTTVVNVNNKLLLMGLKEEIENTDWKVRAIGTKNNTITVDGNLKKVPANMKGIYDDINTALKNRNISDEKLGQIQEKTTKALRQHDKAKGKKSSIKDKIKKRLRSSSTQSAYKRMDSMLTAAKKPPEDTAKQNQEQKTTTEVKPPTVGM